MKTSGGLDPAHMPALPAQGLVIEKPHGQGLMLVGLNGKVYGRLSVFSFNRDTTRSDGLFSQLQDATDVVVVDREGQWYELGGSPTTLKPLARPELALMNGYDLVAHVNNRGWLRTSLERGGKVVLRDISSLLPGGTLVKGTSQDDFVVIDLKSGDRWLLSETCIPIAERNHRLLAVCPKNEPGNDVYLRVSVTTIGAHGSSELAPVRLFKGTQGIGGGLLSPDGNHVLVNARPGCGVGSAYFLSTRSGTGKPVLSTSDQKFKGFESESLGWSASGQAVIRLLRSPNCEAPGPADVYLTNPTTLAQKFVYRVPSKSSQVEMWNPALATLPAS